MKIILATARHTWGWTRCLAPVALVLVVLLLLASRLFLPYLGGYRAAAEQEIGDYLHATVRIDGLEATWAGWVPAVRMTGFKLLDTPRGVPTASFQEARATFDLPRSLLAGRPVFDNVLLRGTRLVVDGKGDHESLLADLALGMSAPDVVPSPLPALAAWLFDVKSLDLLLDELQFSDDSVSPLIFRNLRLSLRDEGAIRHLGMAVEPPQSLGQHIRASATLHEQTGASDFYFEGDGLELDAGLLLPLHRAAFLKAVPRGRADIDLWGEWRTGRLAAVAGQARIQELVFPVLPGGAAANRPSAGLADIRAEFDWRLEADGWRWRSDWQGEDGSGKSVLDCAVNLLRGNPEADRRLQGSCQALPVQQLADLTLPWLNEAHRTAVEDLAPQGRVAELKFIADLGENLSSTSYALSARIEDLATRSWRGLPAFAGLEGMLSLDHDGGRVELESEDVKIHAEGFLDTPIHLGSLRGPIEWRKENAGLGLASSGLAIASEGMTARLQGNVTLFDDGSGPLLDGRVDLQDLDVAHVRRYLPAFFMPPKLVAWLERALVSGTVSSGQLTYRGRGTDFPIAEDRGLFEARFQVEDAVLDYFPDWPRIEALTAEVAFRNRRFRIEATTGHIFDTKIERIEGQIADLGKPLLTVRGRVRGESATLLRFLSESPVAPKLGGYARGLEASGDNIMDLDLTIPFDEKPIQVRGLLAFRGGSLRLPAWGLDLTRIQGELKFTNEALSAQNLQALFRGEPAQLAIDTRMRGDGRRETRFLLSGRFASSTILGDAANRMSPSLFEGKTDWNAVLLIPTTEQGASGVNGPAEFELMLESDLAGLALNLPSPVGKRADARRAFMAHAVRSANGTVRLWLDYEPDIDVALELTDAADGLRFQRGELRIAAGVAVLRKTPGLAVVAHLPRLDLASLGNLVKRDEATNRSGWVPSWLGSVEARLDELIIGSQRFQNVDIQLTPDREGLTAKLRGENIAGRLHIPRRPTAVLPVSVELRRLGLERRDGEGVASTSDPRDFLPLQVEVEELILDGRPLGRLRLSASPRPGGLRLSEITLESELHRMAGSGDWLATERGQRCRLRASLHSAALGETLRAFGYAVALERGEAEIDLEVSWPASLSAFAPALLNGHLELQVGAGQLLGVEPGVGRVFGLFNLDSLWRRLALDFSDLFRQGLAFDLIEGTFTFRDRQARTEDLSLEGPSAEVRISGRIGLEARDYEQTVTVTPRLGLALPIAGAIAGGPAVGAAVFFAERLLQGEIGRVTRYRYSISGPWESPVITQLGSFVTEAKSSGFGR